VSVFDDQFERALDWGLLWIAESLQETGIRPAAGVMKKTSIMLPGWRHSFYLCRAGIIPRPEIRTRPPLSADD